MDELHEAAQHLHFLMQGAGLVLAYETGIRQMTIEPCDLCATVSRFLHTLAPVLERRAMRIVSEECPPRLIIHNDATVLAYTVWAMLIACLYYAQDDSALHIELQSDTHELQLRVYSSRNNPQALTPEERDAYLSARLEEPHTHMFVYALAHHPNTHLAMQLARLMDGRIHCQHKNAYCAVLSLALPRVLPGTADSP